MKVDRHLKQVTPSIFKLSFRFDFALNGRHAVASHLDFKSFSAALGDPCSFQGATVSMLHVRRVNQIGKTSPRMEVCRCSEHSAFA